MTTNMFNLLISKNIDTEDAQAVSLDGSLSCADILKQILNQLEFNETKDYNLLIYIGFQNNFICDLEKPLEYYAKPGGRLVPQRDRVRAKISRDEEESVKVKIDLTIPVEDVLQHIADDIQLYCQPDQYSLWYYNEEGYKFPLESNRCIALQTTFVKHFYFRRRYFLIFSYDYEDMDSCIHVFRDCRYNYTHSSINVTEEQAFELAKLILYGQTQNLKDLNIDLISEKFKEYVPKQFRESSLMANKCKKYIMQSAALDRLPAMIQFIKTVREIRGFGEEMYSATLTDKKYQKKKVDLYCISRGLRICEKGNTQNLFNIHSSSIKEFGYHANIIDVRYVDQKTNEENTCHFTVKPSRLFHIHSYIIDINKLYYKFIKNKMNMRKIRRKQKVRPEVTTIQQANEVIDEFLQSEILNRENEISSDRLRVETEPEQLKRDDYSSFDEISNVSSYLIDDEEFAKRITTYLPKYNLDYYDVQGTIQRLENIATSIQAQIDNSFKMTIKDASYSVECALFYVNAINDGFHAGDISKEIDSIVKSIQMLFVTIKQNDTMKLGITDIRKNVIQGYQSIVDQIPTVVEKCKEIQKQMKEPPPATKEEFAQLPRGAVYLSALVEAIYRLMGALFDIRLDLLNAEVNILKLFPVLSKFANKTYKFWQELESNTCDIKGNLNDLILTYREIYPYLQSAFKAYKMPPELLNTFHLHFRRVLNFTWLGLICFVNPGETVGIKFFPGTLYLRHQALNALQDAVKYFTQLMNLSNIQADPKLMELIRRASSEFENTQTVALKVMNDVINQPTNDALRFVMIQAINVSRRYFLEIIEYCVKLGPNIQPEIIQQLNYFLNSIDSFLYSLSPMNISATRVRTFSESLTALVTAMKDQQSVFGDAWINKMSDSRDQFLEWNKVLAKSPTDGGMLFNIHQKLHNITQNIVTLRTYLEADNHRTIPIIIEVMMPSIAKTLANPEMRDDYEKCVHVSAFCQLHMNVAKLITYLTNVALTPQVAVQENALAKLSVKMDKAKEDYNKLTQIRPHLMQNPFNYTLYLNIKVIVNNLLINLANIVEDAENISAVTCSNAACLHLADVFRAARTYYDKCVEVNLRPYMKVYPKESIVEYRKEVIGLMAQFRDFISTNQDLRLNPLIEKENSEIKVYIKDLMKFEADPSTAFNIYTAKIYEWLLAMYARTNDINGMWNEKRKGVLDHLIEHTDTIRSGEKPSPQILTHVITILLDIIKEYPGKIQPVATAADDKNIGKFLSIFKAIHQVLEESLKNSKFKPKDIEEIRLQLVYYMHFFPELSAQVKENVATKRLLMQFDDLVNLMRQMLMPSSIDYVWEPIVAVDSNDIGELAAALKKMFEDMAHIFAELEFHPIVDDSIRISTLVRQVSQFYQTNASVLNMSREQLEKNLPSFCRGIEAEMEAMINLIKLLGPILTDRQLIDTCEAVQQTVNNVIKLSDSHFLTSAKATEFSAVTYPLAQKLVLLMREAIKKGVVHDSKGFLEELIAAIEQIPSNVDTMKPHEIQALANKLYETLLKGFADSRTDIDPTDFAPLLYELYNQVGGYISKDPVPVMKTETLMFSPSHFEGKDIKALLEKYIAAINGEAAGEEADKNVMELITIKDDQAKSSPAMYKYFSKYANDSKNIKKQYAYSRFLAMAQAENAARIEGISNIIIQSSLKSAQIIEAMREEIKNTKMRTVYHRQLVESLKNADLSMITSLKNMPGVAFVYSPMRLINQLVVLSRIQEEKFTGLAKELNDSLQSADASIQAMLANVIAQLAHKCEKLNIFPDFVNNACSYLRKPHIMASYDAEFTAKLINMFMTFDTASAAVINEKADNKDYQELKALIDSISPIRPLLQQLTSPASARQEATLNMLIQAIVQMYNSTKTGKNDIEEFEALRSIAKTTAFNLHTATETGVDTKKYAEGIKLLDAAILAADEAALAISKGNSALSLKDGIVLLDKAFASFATATGEIEADEEEEVKEEEEEVKEEEEKVEYVNVQSQIPALFEFILAQNWSKLAELADKCVFAIEGDNQVPELAAMIKEVKEGADSKNSAKFDNFIEWYSTSEEKEIKTAKKPTTSISNIEAAMLDTIDEFRALRTIFGKNPTLDGSNLVRLCAEAQYIAGEVFKQFQFVSPAIFEFYIQTANQLWPNVLTVLNNINNQDAHKSALRSIARLISDFSYVLEDCTLQESQPSTTELTKSRFEFGIACSNMIKQAGELLCAVASGRYQQLYKKLVFPLASSFNSPVSSVESSSKKLMEANLKTEINDDFKPHSEQEVAAYKALNPITEKFTDVKDALNLSIAFFKAAFAAFTDTKQMSDVVEKKKDPESAKKLPVRFTIPVVPADNVTIEAVSKQLPEAYKAYQEQIDFINKALADDTEVTNDQLVEATARFHERAKDLVITVLKASAACIDVGDQSNLTALANNVVLTVNDITKGVKAFLMVETGWKANLETTITESTHIIQNINEVVDHAIEVSNAKSAEEDLARRAIGDLAKPFFAIQQQTSEKGEEISKFAPSVQREYGSSLGEVTSTLASTIAKIIMYLRDHQQDINGTQDNLKASATSGAQKLQSVVDSIVPIAQKEESEDMLIESCKLVIQTAEEFKTAFKAQRGELVAHSETLTGVIGIAKKLIEAAEAAKKARAERAEALRRREEEAARRRAAAEERKRLAAERKAKQPAHQPPKELLMKLLKLESDIIKCRLYLRQQKKVVDQLNAE